MGEPYRRGVGGLRLSTGNRPRHLRPHDRERRRQLRLPARHRDELPDQPEGLPRPDGHRGAERCRGGLQRREGRARGGRILRSDHIADHDRPGPGARRGGSGGRPLAHPRRPGGPAREGQRPGPDAREIWRWGPGPRSPRHPLPAGHDAGRPPAGRLPRMRRA